MDWNKTRAALGRATAPDVAVGCGGSDYTRVEAADQVDSHLRPGPVGGYPRRGVEGGAR